MRDKRTKQRAITKAITVFIGGLLFAAYLEWQHSDGSHHRIHTVRGSAVLSGV